VQNETLSRALTAFFREEFEREARRDFSLIARLPDSLVAARLWHYRRSTISERNLWADFCAHRACAAYGFVVGLKPSQRITHPFFERWAEVTSPLDGSVNMLRMAVAQYKIDKHRGVKSCVSEELFAYASSIRSIKAPELRKRVRAALKPLGYVRLTSPGLYLCRNSNTEFEVDVDFGGRSAQLRYCVSFPEFPEVHSLLQFRFENVLGFGNGDWDFIVEENVDDAFAAFSEVVGYCVALPDRIRSAVVGLSSG
jgi:hypothetical protein